MELLRLAYVAIVDHSLACVPNEACGLVAGRRQRRIEHAYCLANVESSPTRFTIDPVEHFQSMTDAESKGMEIIGVFHSHTRAPAFPSATDIAEASDLDWIQLIVSLSDPARPEVRAFYIRDRTIDEVEVEVLDHS